MEFSVAWEFLRKAWIHSLSRGRSCSLVLDGSQTKKIKLNKKKRELQTGEVKEEALHYFSSKKRRNSQIKKGSCGEPLSEKI